MLVSRAVVFVFLAAVAIEGASSLSLVARLSQSSNLTTASAEVLVVGGEEVELGEVPYMVSLQDVRWTPTQPRHYCGGAIYDASTVITAAHCVSSFTKDYFGMEVVAGEHQRSVTEGSEQVMEVKDIILHPGYNTQTYENDIAIIKLTKNLNFNEYVQPIGLPPEGKTLEGECMVAGWGPKTEGGEDMDVPYKASVPIWSNDDCANTLETVFYVTEHMVCAGYEEGGIGACESDSGSPLTCYSNANPFLGGVVSWQFGCSRPFRPTVYTNMVYFSQWLIEQVSI